MNTVYKVVWNASRRVWVVAGEFSRARTKSSLVSSVLGTFLLLGSSSVFSSEFAKTITLQGDGTDVQIGNVTAADGQNAVKIETATGSYADKNIVSVGENILIRGGKGSDSGAGGDGSDGGIAVQGSNITLTNHGTIQGGKGGRSFHGDGGDGGTAVEGSNITLTNHDTIQGGYGGDGSYGASGEGGKAVRGDNITLTNHRTIQGGYGGNGGNGGDGGDGGIAVQGNNITLTNHDTIQGGIGGIGGESGQGGNGGIAVQGSNITLTNHGTIQGGAGGIGGVDGEDGARGTAVQGNNITLTNHGTIQGGEGGNGAIEFTGGNNTLTLGAGSQVQGNVVLSDGAANNKNKLTFISNMVNGYSVTGNFTAGNESETTLTGDNSVRVSEGVWFRENSTLILRGAGGMEADKMNFTSSSKVSGAPEITNWDRASYDLLKANQIDGLTEANVTTSNPLLSDGAPDYAYANLTATALTYNLRWNDQEGNGHGEFSLKDGKTLTLGVVLADNTGKAHTSGWEGKSLTKSGKGTLILAAQNTYSGATTVREGTLKTAVENAIAGTSGVTVNEGATLNLSGLSQIVTGLANSGTALINDTGAPLLTTPVTVTGDMTLEKSGRVVLNNSASNVGQTWIQKGNWTGHGGTVSLGTVLGDDSSKTDRLEITGHASGTTYVAVTNKNGSGEKTLEGINLIGTGSSDKDAFVQAGRIVAGAYDYKLQQGTASGKNTNNWYLTSYLTNPTPVPGDDGIHIWRPEAGSYVANLMAANTMFSSSLNDRHGSVLVDPVTGQRHESTLWGRAIGGHNEHHLTDGQSKTTANRMVYQLGGEMLTTSFTGDDAMHLGVMGAYGRQSSKTHNKYTGYSSRGTVSGYTAGLYGTWFQDEETRTGLYADTWVQYGWFDNTVKGDGLADEKYHSKGFTASLETGYVYPALSWTSAGGMDNTLYLRPQAQVIWFGVKAKDHTEHNGTVVKSSGTDNVQTKLGVRVSMTGQSHLDKGSVRKFEPFAEVSWVWNSEQYGVTMGDKTNHLKGSRNVAELKAGVEGRITDNLGLWGNVSQQVGGNSYSDTQGMLGVKYTF